ncbi:tetratricopeptide repeat protein [Rhodopirellula sp. MGV]|uniref:tetratricopeptide repeat protein n=1 Tax=Rhodopirellula sp. MGV TaxID=2023130 RepID=UPI000B96AD0C|nr:tetratricopeptide repeat protein [Rhodopirellula sp. MGV]OYP38518.1 hypothetical protein CGZ80_01860 [Rhodopirellula sp. MGV]PNY34838.1 tetratricopeptide repeat protein [Rhodopirellula baltica]
MATFLTMFGTEHRLVIGKPPLNSDANVEYIGTEACRQCHRSEHQSYLQTLHSRSMEVVDPEKEQVPATFTHELSQTRYEVLRRGDRLVHRESLLSAENKVIASNEREIVFTVGSGAHGKSYVYRDEGFYGQSPISWYKDSKRWEMSPSYDLPFHVGFGRKLTSECFFCHVGSIDRKERNPSDFEIVEHTIGCERCHGPGQLHAERYRKEEKPSGADSTIVNPAKLPREVSESICQQCHLQAAGKALVSNRDEWDFRPGLRLTDFRVDYQYRLGDNSMRVVGHVEQLHASECYQQTESLTCITCHDPHHTVTPENTVLHYRNICLSCHDEGACGESYDRRLEMANNDCTQCHMPRKDTEVPHTALTHHQIGIHRGKVDEDEIATGLTAVLDLAHLSPTEQDRCAAIAKFQVMQEQPGNANFRDYGFEAAKALINVKNAGKADAEATAVLAMLARSQNQVAIAKELASEIVRTETKSSRARIESLRLLAQFAYDQGNFKTAVKHYRQLTQLQSEPHDHFQLAIAEQNTGQTNDAIQSLQRAINLAPAYIDAHRLLAALLERNGDTKQAAVHSDLAVRHQTRLQNVAEAAND